jgi:enoyl-CoA hydratase/carnithine racemase
MTRLTKFDEYKDRYSNSYVLEMTDDGILFMRMHTDGGPAVWGRIYYDTCNLLGDLAGDRDIRVIILTGTGDSFNANWRPSDEQIAERQANPTPPSPPSPEFVEEMGWYGRNRHNNILDIDAIMIAAVNGPVTIHSELPLMCDIVLASEDAYFQDGAHFLINLSPGDGVQNIWPRVIGWNRFRYWQLMGQQITAKQAFEWGAVNEVLPRDTLLDRAWEIAHYLLRFPPMTLRHTRRTFIREFKRAAHNDLAFGQYMELFGMAAMPTDYTLWDGGVLPG